MSPFYSHLECALACGRLFLFFSNGFCANQLSILVTEKNKFKIKKIILNGFKITALAEKPVKSLSLSLPNKRTFILNHWEKNIHHPLCMLFCLPGLVFSENIWRFSLPGAFWLAFLISMLANKHGPVFHSLMSLERPPTCGVLEMAQLNRCRWVSMMHPVTGGTMEMQSCKGHSPRWLTSCLGREQASKAIIPVQGDLCGMRPCGTTFSGELDKCLFSWDMETFLVAVAKCLIRRRLGEKEFILAHSSRVQIIIMGKAWWQEWETPGHIS